MQDIRFNIDAKIFWVKMIILNGLKINFEIGVSIQHVHVQRHSQLDSICLSHSNLECFDCNGWKLQMMHISKLPCTSNRSMVLMYRLQIH